MKTAPFDLELAKLGHPLVTRGGVKVVEAYHFTTYTVEYPLRCILDSMRNTAYGYTTEGVYDKELIEHKLDLLLDLETPWEKPLQQGEEILCKGLADEWFSCIFIVQDGPSVFVRSVSGHLCAYETWKRPDPIVEEKTTLDVEIKVGGQPVSLEDFKKLVNKL